MTVCGWQMGKLSMRVARIGAMDISTALLLLIGRAFSYSAWLTSIVFCAAGGHRPLLIASATFFPIGIVHGVGVSFGGW
jgi:hypothetical protein